MPVSQAAKLLGWLGAPEGASDAELADRVAALAELPAPQEPSSRRLLVLFVEAVSEVLATERYQTAVDTAVFADGRNGVLQRNANCAMWVAAAVDLGRGRRIVSPALCDFATRSAVRAHDAGPNPPGGPVPPPAHDMAYGVALAALRRCGGFAVQRCIPTELSPLAIRSSTLP
jgi:hypothetical protein